jgi:hypothetical protein
MTTATAPAETVGTGERREIARYCISSGERVIHAQRIDGAVRLTDKPAVGGGRSYLIESGLHVMAELEAIVADYLRQAATRDTVPVLIDP